MKKECARIGLVFLMLIAVVSLMGVVSAHDSYCSNYKCVVHEGESVSTIFQGRMYNISIEFISLDSVVLDFNGKSTQQLNEDDWYRLDGENMTIFVVNILYSSKTNVSSSVEISLSSCGNYICSGGVEGSVGEGRIYTNVLLNGKWYNVSLEDITDTEVTLNINQQSTDYLEEGNRWILSDGVLLMIKDINHSGRVGFPGSVTFILGETHTSCPSDCRDSTILCYNDSNCPPVHGTPYCNGSMACGAVTFYRCENPGTTSSRCVSYGGGLGCTNCPNGCSNGACVSGNSTCGNGRIDAGEVCDGTNLGGRTCQSQGYNEGTLSCCSDCMHYDFCGCKNITYGTCVDHDGGSTPSQFYIVSNVTQSVGYTPGPVCPSSTPSGCGSGGGLGIGLDSCNGSFNLIEKICNANNSVGSVTYACPDGCSAGACMQTPTGTCSRNQSGQMRCRYYGPSKGGPAVWTQKCIVRGRNSQGAWTNIAACPYGCSNGVCASGSSGGGGGSGSPDYGAGYLRESSQGFWSSIIGWFKNLFS